MIQRIQSVYLFLATVAAVLVFVFPLAVFTGLDFSGVLKVSGLNLLQNSPNLVSVNTIPLMILLAVVALLSIVAIFYFKNRSIQLKIVKANIIASVIFVALIFLYCDRISGKITETKPVTYQAGAYIALVIVVLLILATRRISHDEKKVRAADRIR